MGQYTSRRPSAIGNPRADPTFRQNNAGLSLFEGFCHGKPRTSVAATALSHCQIGFFSEGGMEGIRSREIVCLNRSNRFSLLLRPDQEKSRTWL